MIEEYLNRPPSHRKWIEKILIEGANTAQTLVGAPNNSNPFLLARDVLTPEYFIDWYEEDWEAFWLNRWLELNPNQTKKNAPSIREAVYEGLKNISAPTNEHARTLTLAIKILFP